MRTRCRIEEEKRLLAKHNIRRDSVTGERNHLSCGDEITYHQRRRLHLFRKQCGEIERNSQKNNKTPGGKCLSRRMVLPQIVGILMQRLAPLRGIGASLLCVEYNIFVFICQVLFCKKKSEYNMRIGNRLSGEKSLFATLLIFFNRTIFHL